LLSRVFRIAPQQLIGNGRRVLDLAITFLIAGNSFSAVDYCCQRNARIAQAFVAPRRFCGGRETASALRLLQLKLLEAEVEYAN
jgi:hypothetical protein